MRLKILVMALAMTVNSYAAAAVNNCEIDKKRAKEWIAEASQKRSIEIKNDLGGCIKSYVFAVENIPKNTRIILSGVCGSSCTLFIGHKGACARSGTVFKFHGPSFQGKNMGPTAFKIQSELMAGFYPEPLREKFLQELRHKVRGYTSIRAEKLIAQGVIRLCP